MSKVIDDLREFDWSDYDPSRSINEIIRFQGTFPTKTLLRPKGTPSKANTLNSIAMFLLFFVLIQLCRAQAPNLTTEVLETELTSTVPFLNKTFKSNSAVNIFHSRHDTSSSEPNKLPVNWHYFTWPILGSILLMTSIAWIVIRNRSGTRVLYMSRIPRIIRPYAPQTVRI